MIYVSSVAAESGDRVGEIQLALFLELRDLGLGQYRVCQCVYVGRHQLRRVYVAQLSEYSNLRRYADRQVQVGSLHLSSHPQQIINTVHTLPPIIYFVLLLLTPVISLLYPNPADHETFCL